MSVNAFVVECVRTTAFQDLLDAMPKLQPAFRRELQQAMGPNGKAVVLGHVRENLERLRSFVSELESSDPKLTPKAI